jgi:hypothetical protein
MWSKSLSPTREKAGATTCESSPPWWATPHNCPLHISAGKRGEGRTEGLRQAESGWLADATHAVKGIDGNVKLNKALWHLTERLAELKAK